MSEGKEGRELHELSFSIGKCKNSLKRDNTRPAIGLEFERGLNDEEDESWLLSPPNEQSRVKDDEGEAEASEVEDYELYFEEDRAKNEGDMDNGQRKIKYGMNILGVQGVSHRDRQSKYVERMKKNALFRKIEHEMAIERKIHKENKTAIDEDTQIFITSEYKAQLDERRFNQSILRNRDAEVESAPKMDKFYSNLKYNVALGGAEATQDDGPLLRHTREKHMAENYYDKKYYKQECRELQFNNITKSKVIGGQGCPVKNKPRRNDEKSIEEARKRYQRRKNLLIGGNLYKSTSTTSTTA